MVSDISPTFHSIAGVSRAQSEQTASHCNSSLLNYDLVIVGGGIAGLTLACGLQSSGVRVAVIEAQTSTAAAGRRRAYALSPMSAKIFEGLGLWNHISPQVTHFEQVRLSDADFGPVVEFCPKDLGRDAVYYAADHGVLMTALQEQLNQGQTTTYLTCTHVVDVQYHSDGATVQAETAGERYLLNAQLVVAADGAKSALRQQANISTVGWRYWQSCITAVLAPEKFHGNTAYERFWPSGPFAILPLPNGHCQIVWTASHAEAEALVNLPKTQFMAELQKRYGSHMGHLELVSEPMIFPVQLMQSRAYIGARLALVGDAAHCCHPVGGQGLNMGIRDGAALAEVLGSAHANGEDLGSVEVLKRYDRWRRRENWAVLGLTDLLNRSFSNRWWPLVIARRLGIVVLQAVVPLRRLALRLMAGFFGRLPAFAQSAKTFP
ncbi:MAG: FAD-dependent hydroxylase [Cyanobacteria bacterium P01_D01_bin.128]